MQKGVIPVGNGTLTVWLLLVLVGLMGFNTGGHITRRRGQEDTIWDVVVDTHTHTNTHTHTHEMLMDITVKSLHL